MSIEKMHWLLGINHIGWKKVTITQQIATILEPIWAYSIQLLGMAYNLDRIE